MSLINRVNAELKGDRVIWMIVAILALFSVLAVYSSSGMLAFKESGGNTEYYLIKQMIVLGTGLFLTYLCYLIHYTRYKNFAPYMLMFVVPLLAYTLFFGRNINNAKRWIMIPGIGITFQTSDLAKIAIICFVARAISAKQDVIKDFQSAFVPIIVPVILVCLLIAPADLSTALVIFVTCFLMMFVGRVAMKYLGLMLMAAAVGFGALLVIGRAFPNLGVRIDTWVTRIRDFVEGGGSSVQSQMAKIAIANGGWTGVGPGNSTQRNFLPACYTDYIYSVIIEEYGLIGAGLLMGLYILLFFRIVRLVTISPRTFGAMLALGFGLILVIQALANMAVSVHLVPVSGLPMPMVSMGGTSLLFSCVSFGIILSVSKYIEAAKDN
jgi:cell division protein FtsW